MTTFQHLTNECRNGQRNATLLSWRIGMTIVLLLLALTLTAQEEINPDDYRIEQKDIDRALQLINAPQRTDVVMPNPAPGAQWFPEAGLGLFMHWGIHSVDGVQPSWNMVKHYRYAGKHPHSRRQYYALAKKFKPEGYNPARYLKACKDAGFTYAVLTTRHHDGYALWPSKYGIGTKQYMGGRDLIKEYVAACRKTGMRVGLYYSPRDWHFPGATCKEEFDDRTRDKLPPITDSVANYQQYIKYMAYVMTQLEELLTRYGKIDVLWLDGSGWRGIRENNTNKIYAWIRSMQPDIVIDDRWANIVDPDNPSGTSVRIGDFTTPFECSLPTYVPSKWWEAENLWTYGGGWGYDKKGKFRTLSWFFDNYIGTRSLGGNFLVNIGPDENGNMHPNFYNEIDSLTSWMIYGRESVIGTQPTPGPELSNVYLTTRGQDTLYAHVLPKSPQQVSIKTDRLPREMKLLRNLHPVKWMMHDGYLHFMIPKAERTKMDDVVKIIF
ncbi:MAG: alpha-L-fucosidase [Prevotella sp.]|jgi:alpha-L-fucosidase|nr:alpha-L-fucosidase [Prevotella sp.]